MATAPKKTEVTAAEEKPKASLVLAEGLDLSLVEEDSGHGVDNMDVGDVAMPFLYLTQKTSPMTDAASPQYIEGAVAGLFFNNVSRELYEARTKGFLFVPCYYERKYVEWGDINNGGGWKAAYDITSDILDHTVKNDKGKPVMKGTGNPIVETAYHYGLFLHPEEEIWQQCVIPLKSTGLRQNKRLNNELVTQRIPGSSKIAPRWLFPYRVTAASESKGQNTWWGHKFTREEGTVTKDVYVRAKEYAELIGSGTLRVTESNAPKGEGVADDDIPF